MIPQKILFALIIILVGEMAQASRLYRERRTKKFKVGTLALNIQPLASIYSMLSANLEILTFARHGILLSYSKSIHADEDSYSYNLGYRYHFKEGFDSRFLGIYIGQQFHQGDDEFYSTDRKRREKGHFETTTLRYGINYGRRIVWRTGLNFAWRIGLGPASPKTRYFDEHNIKRNEESYEGLSSQFAGELKGVVDAEISIGYAI